MNTVELEFLNNEWNSQSINPSPLYHRVVNVNYKELERLVSSLYQNNLFAWFKKFTYMSTDGEYFRFRGNEIIGIRLISSDNPKAGMKKGVLND